MRYRVTVDEPATTSRLWSARRAKGSAIAPPSSGAGSTTTAAAVSAVNGVANTDVCRSTAWSVGVSSS